MYIHSFCVNGVWCVYDFYFFELPLLTYHSIPLKKLLYKGCVCVYLEIVYEAWRLYRTADNRGEQEPCR